ncbi:MAG TPA: glycosyltransferase family 39 protein [Terriglobales bacterium]|nr:glycosyltransferase family 39 protein [Terriglobales bacterium]
MSFAAAIFAGCMFSPSLMDDVDAVQAQIARNMLESGDWVTARLNGVKYLEKAPLPYWLMAVSYRVFGVHDWVARLWLVLTAIALCLVTRRFGRWAFGEQAGLYAGLVLATCIGLWLFTRILIPDAALTLTIIVGLWSLLRALDDDEARPRRWALLLAASLAAGLLLKGLIGIVFPIGAAFLYLVITRQLFARRTWRRLHPFAGLAVIVLIAAPWHLLAILRNPPYFDFTMRSEPGHYRGFFWFYFLNEHLFRFLNLRYPRDYNTVPRWWFWLSQLVWLGPWSVFLPAAARLSYRPADRAGRARLLALCWIGVVMLFFTLSTTQEYYSMPIYPALALLIGSPMAGETRWSDVGTKVVAAVATVCALGAGTLLYLVRNVPTPGDISSALSRNEELYTLSLGHMADLTLNSFAYLRLPLLVAAVGFALGAVTLWVLRGWRAYIAMAAMMVVFFHAARLAMSAFDPYMSSRPLAVALERAPAGELIVDGHYYPFSSVFFYTNRPALLLNGRRANFEYGSNAPDAPDVFINDGDLQQLWAGPRRYYLLTPGTERWRIEKLLGHSAYVVRESGGKVLFTNRPEPPQP